jgi:hypothetical protein
MCFCRNICVAACPLPVYSLLWIPSAYTRRVAASQAYAKQPGKPSIPALARDCESMTAEVAAFHSHPASALARGCQGDARGFLSGAEVCTPILQRPTTPGANTARSFHTQ